MANDNEVLVKINGDSKVLQDAVDSASKALRELGKALDDTSKKANDTAPGGGKSSLDQYRFSLDSLTESVLKSMGGFGGFMVALNSTIGVVTEIASVIGGAVEGFLHFAETVGGVVVDALRQAGEEAAKLTEQVFDLNKTTEQATGSWRYIYGGGGPGAQKMTEGIMNWSSQFAFNIPYTRQDLHDAITALGRAGLPANTVEQYMSDIADMGALNPQRNLTQAAWSIQGAMHGYSRMLKYDYGINPDELYDFGYDENNPEQTLLPALHNYLKARGMLGAAKYAATNTFWGAESSFVDRLQNFGLEVGGTALNGDIAPNSMFGVLKTDLTGLSKWWDDHQKQIGQIADFFKNILGGAFKTASDFMKGFTDGLKSSGFETFAQGTLKSLSDLFNSKELQSGASSVGALAGKGIGALLTDIGIGIKGLLDGFNSNQNGGTAVDGLHRAVDWLIEPTTRQKIYEVGGNIGILAGHIKDLADALTRLMSSMTPEDWHILEEGLIIVGGLLGGMFLTAIVALALPLLALAAPILGFIAFLWLLKEAVDLVGQGIKSVADALKGIHWPTFGPAQPGTPGAPEVPGGSGPTTSTGGGNAPMVAFSNSNATSLHFYGASSAQVAYQTNRLLDERDRGSYLAKRTPGGLNTLGILG